MTTGLLLLRIVFGLLLVGHGTQKLFGWFGGPGLAGVAGWFESLGFRPGKPMAILAGLGEAGGGLLLALGLFTPLAAAIVVGTLLVAVSTHLAGGLWAQQGGFELPLLYAAVAAGLAFTGPGAASLDNVLGLDLTAAWYGIAAVGVGVLAALAVIVRARVSRKSAATSLETVTA